ncbi:tetratricopeptide repeat protein 36 [Lycorma delicatula]|uniref:tetratricopeptide repeat protein 36 n=1 Tax=Lycorma delicatula TaxID=130591 RepID=UPI003F51120C
MISENDRAILNSIFNPLSPITTEFNYDTDRTKNIDGIKENAIDKDVKEMEIKGIYLAESGDLKSAENLLTRAIDKSPKYASLYNNRAQVYRLQGLTSDALNDLNEAIKLTEGGQGKCGSQALCQRALLYGKLEREEEALKDWSTAARNGSEYAKSVVVKKNPYSALCNQMLQVIISGLKEQTAEDE